MNITNMENKMIRLKCKLEGSLVLRAAELSSEYEKMSRFISMTHARNEKIEADLLSAEKQTNDLVMFLCKRSGRH
jgi:hypothetical protein